MEIRLGPPLQPRHMTLRSEVITTYEAPPARPSRTAVRAFIQQMPLPAHCGPGMRTWSPPKSLASCVLARDDWLHAVVVEEGRAPCRVRPDRGGLRRRILLLVVSHQSRGAVDLASGDPLARDRQETGSWFDAARRGRLTIRSRRQAGLYCGKGTEATASAVATRSGTAARSA
jgi:hypothetical protein